jgi:hypothetical protein
MKGAGKRLFVAIYSPHMRNVLFVAVLAAFTASAFAESAAGMRWTAPANWKAEAARPMRAATYSIPLAAGDQGIAECVVNYFGPGQGGGVDANIERWRGQMLGPDGKPAAGKIDKRAGRGVPITVIDTTGTYSGMGGPMSAGAKPVPGYRLIGAIVEGPGGSVFFKLTGPAKTIAAQQKTFEQLLASIQVDK